MASHRLDILKLLFARPFLSIADSVSEEELADFIVLSGPNGAGKSHLLQAIKDGSLPIEGMSQPPNYVRMFSITELIPPAESAASTASIPDSYMQVWDSINQARTQLPQAPNYVTDQTQLSSMVINTVLNIRQITPIGLSRVLQSAGKTILNVELEDLRRYMPFLSGIRDPFLLRLTEIFMAYHKRRNRNDFEHFLISERGRTDVSPLSDADFRQSFGPPPWEALDTTLQLLGLDYKFVPPEGDEDTLLYTAQLIRSDESQAISTDALSSGEKTLLTIASTLYTSGRLTETIEMPSVLLLDEADASLHPSMVGSLLKVIREIFVEQSGVRVILTTHSPTTVALAPEESLYVMQRDSRPRLRKASRDEALLSLTVGVPTMSVSMDHRRQVFVESENDESVYLSVFSLLRTSIGRPYSLEFIASGKGGNGNVNAVRRLVTELRNAGNTSVFGIVDRDNRGSAPDGIFYNPDRYTLENLVLDPLALGTYLLREEIIAPEAMQLDRTIRHFQLAEEHGQSIVNFVTSRVNLGPSRSAVKTVEYEGRFGLAYPEAWLTMNGKELLAQIKIAFAPLNGPLGANLMGKIVSQVFRDVPEFIPKEFRRLFESVLS